MAISILCMPFCVTRLSAAQPSEPKVTAFLIFEAPVFSELTVKDLENIRSIIKESEDRLREDLKCIQRKKSASYPAYHQYWSS